MSQYHVLYNTDKEEYVHGHDINNGLKLMEQVGFNGSTASALFLLIANSNGRGGGDAVSHPMIGRWAGDRIVVQGDYAESTDPGYIANTEDFTNISPQVVGMINEVF